MRHFLLLLAALLLLNTQVSPAPAAEIRGELQIQVGPYLLLRTAAGQKVVRTGPWTAYGNLDGPGGVKYGGEQLRIGYDEILAGVYRADSVSRETVYLPAPDLVIDLEQLSMELGFGTVLLLDSRNAAERAAAYIPGSLPYSGAAELKQRLANQGNIKRIAFYGSWAGDLRPYNGAQEAAAAGLDNISIFSGGLDGWRKAGKPVLAAPEHLAALLAEGSPFRLIDLREPAPGNRLLLQGAETIAAVSATREKLFMPERVRQLPLFLYGDEKESLAVAAQLARWDFHKEGDLAILDQTWREWSGAGSAVNYRPGELPANEIDYGEFRALWEQGDSQTVLLNVKPQRDRNIPSELHIPLEELPERLGELPRDKEIVIYCKFGLRSALAWQILHDNGFRVRFLNREISCDSSGNLRNEN